MASKNHELHFLIVPLMSQSHLIPMIDFAKLLAKRGLTVTIITTPLNSTRFEPMIDSSVKAGLKIRFIPLRFPCQEAGLPEGCENFDTLTSPNLVKAFFEASEMLKEPIERLILELEPRVDCMINSNALPWASEIANKFNLPWYIFNAISCFTILLSQNLSLDEIDADTGPDTILVPNMPYKIEFNKSQLLGSISTNSKKFKGLQDQMKKAALAANGSLVNSFEELEQSFIDECTKVKKNTWCIGAVSLSNKGRTEKFNRGNKVSNDEQFFLSWLDSKIKGSVIYACFGSLCHIPFSQQVEVGLGLEASNHNFIWIIRGCDYSAELDKWMKDEEFEERNRSRGLVVCGWAPQVMILSHPSIGGFLTHCGWNSTLEGISAGVPMITWPMFAEQFYNEKLVTQVLRIGVRIGVEVGMEWGKENFEVLVKRNQLKKAIDLLMSEEEEGMERRMRARELGELANRAIEEGGSSYLNISSLIEDVILHLDINNKSVNKEYVKSNSSQEIKQLDMVLNIDTK